MTGSSVAKPGLAASGGVKVTPRDVIGHLAACIVGGFFVYAAWGKITDVYQFSVEILNYKMPWMSPRYVNIPAILLPWIEVFAGIALIIPRTRKGAALVICGLLAFFIYAIFDAAILRDLKISCGCTGKDSGPAGWMAIGRNVLLISATMLAVYLPRKETARDVVGHLCALVVGGFFIYAAWGKLGDVYQFSVEISNYKMPWMNERYVNIPAIILPWLEIAAALALILPRTRKGAALVIGGMLLFFMYAVYDAAIVRRLDISCGCTGKNSGPAGWLTIGRNVLLLAGTALSVYLPRCMACCSSRRTEPVDEASPSVEPA